MDRTTTRTSCDEQGCTTAAVVLLEDLALCSACACRHEADVARALARVTARLTRPVAA